jgi:PAS domain S-box-containing protein
MNYTGRQMSENREKKGIIEPYETIFWVAIICILYVISRSNYLLFHSLAELFSIFVAYVVFLIVWKSRMRLENRYLIFIGIAYFFVASLDLLHTFAYKGMGIFPQSDSNLPTQLWIAARYMESISLLLALLYLINIHTGNEKEYPEPLEKEKFFWGFFLLYAGITAACILSIFVFRNFPDSYIEGSGLTPFKVTSEYLICFIFLCSLVILYIKRDIFDERIFSLLAASLVATIFGELTFTLYIDVYGFSNLIGHFLKVLSFYLIYKAVIQTGFDDPYTLLFRELKQSEEALRQEATFLRGDQGRIYSMLGVKRNEPESELTITGFHIKEKDSRSIVQNFHGLIELNLDQDFEPLSINGALEEITGYSKDDFLSRKVKWREIVVPEDRPLIFEKIEKTMNNQNISTELEYRIKNRDGDVKWIWEILQKFPAAYRKPGEPGKIQSIVRDITERKMVEETLKLKLEELARSNAELEQFAYVSSHDLQEPLRMIVSYLQLLQRRYQGKLDERADKYIYFAVDGASRMQILINDLLEFSRVATKAKEPEYTDCEFVLDQVLADLELFIKENKAKVSHDPLPEVIADNAQLAQVFQNLIINGVKFHSEEAPKIYISAEKKAREWQFSVKDNGIGIDTQYSEKIFEVFKRLHKKEEYPGTGIGLAICKKIIERHSGHIWVESELGKGSTFYFTLPRNPGDSTLNFENS